MNSGSTKKSRLLLWLGILGGGLLIALVGLFFGIQYAISKAVGTYTDPMPREMPVVEVTGKDLKVLKNRWTNFKEALKVGASSEKLELTSHELNVMLLSDEEINRFKGKVVLSIAHQNIVNALLAEDEAMQQLQGNFYVTVQDGKILADISMPLKSLGLNNYGDRYINASGELMVTFTGQRLRVTMNPEEINGENLPDLVLKRVRELDLYEMFVKPHPVYGKLGARIKAVEVLEDTVELELTPGSGPLPSLARDAADDRNRDNQQTVDEIKKLRDASRSGEKE